MTISDLDRGISALGFPPAGVRVSLDLFRSLRASGRVSTVPGLIEGILDIGIQLPVLDGSIVLYFDDELSGEGFVLPSKAPEWRKPTVVPQLSSAAAEMLRVAGATTSGDIYMHQSIGGAHIKSGGRLFAERRTSAREFARWEAALQELVSEGLVAAASSELFRLTHDGWELAQRP